MANGTVGNFLRSGGTIAGGAIGGLGLAYALLANIDHKATTALDVAEQHGAEFLAVRNDFTTLQSRFEVYREEVAAQISQAAQDRYYGREAAKDIKRIDDLISRIERSLDKLEARQQRLEERMARCEKRLQR